MTPPAQNQISFAQVEYLSRTSVPDATTVMEFRHLLEAHDLTKAMLVEVNVMLD